MSDELNQPTGSQPQEAASSDMSDFLGTSPDLSDVADVPEPSATEESESDAEAGAVDAADGEAEGAETQTVEVPRWIEDLELSPDELAVYQKRYPSAFKPEADEDLRYLIRDKVKTDRDIQARMAAEQGEEEPTLDDQAQQQNPVAPSPLSDQQAQQYLQNITGNVDHYIEPKVANPIMAGLIDAMGGDSQQYKPEQLTAIAKELFKAGVVLQHTLYSDPKWAAWQAKQGMSSAYEGFEDTYSSQARAGAIAQLRESDPNVAKVLPTYGTPEWQQAVNKAAEILPGFEHWKFEDPKGGKVSPYRQFQEKAKVMARLLNGQQVQPAVVRQAVETGKQIAAQTQMKRAAGKALGTGQNARQLTPATNDPIMDDLDRAIAAANSGMAPFTPRK